ncbi:hypothetical protein BG015_003736 [Linnemannia schmuckeri]|uniref:Bulb-type lectin domain-containing protein n=1 Tax=Linnemannia schmuckeri TaxID=64567 RepID=A0A9P5RHJ4_9FUNG|nr:hypothetical protein BG015_003736 [Linnemannia schmuckeri]
MYGHRKTVLVNLKLFLAKSEKGQILTLAHEIGHLIGLAHEDKGDGPLWITSERDDKSIMRWRYRESNSITKMDCRAMEFYASGFKTPLMCGVSGGKPVKCKPMTKDVVDLKLVVLPRGAPPYKQLRHDELLVDIHNPDCLGPDISKYFIITPEDNGGYGAFRRGMVISQCLAVRVPSDPNFFYALQSDGNFVSYNIKTGQAVWSTGSQGLGTKGDYDMAFQGDGNLVLYDVTGKAIWSSATYDGSPDRFRINAEFWQFRDGHMFISDLIGRSAWGTFPSFAHTDVIIGARALWGGSSNFVLDAGENKSGWPTKLSAWKNGKQGQRWNVFTDGTIRNKHRHTGKCLDNRGQQLQEGNQIQVYECFDVWSEKWDVDGR